MQYVYTSYYLHNIFYNEMRKIIFFKHILSIPMLKNYFTTFFKVPSRNISQQRI